MNEDIDKVVAQYIEFVYMVVESKGEKTDASPGRVLPDGEWSVNVFYCFVVNNCRKVIEVERTVEAVVVQYATNYDDNNKRETICNTTRID